MFPGAHDAIDALKARGVKLALVTNGAAGTQRAKVERFALTHRFDHIQIEGEHGFGKPDERAYLHAMQALGVTPRDLDDRRQSGMGSRGAAAARHLCDLDRRSWRRPAGGLDRQARPHHPLADRIVPAEADRPFTAAPTISSPRRRSSRRRRGSRCGYAPACARQRRGREKRRAAPPRRSAPRTRAPER